MPSSALYQPKYASSHALVIGINKYKHVGPLIQACNDAQAVAKVLTSRFDFPEGNVELLIDGKATRKAIMQSFFRFANTEIVKPDDRLIIFFAGHGHTAPGRRGEAGFLVPVDGDPADLSSLIRWDDFARNADLISAKHILFIMDACYGGLLLTQTTIPPGSMRLLKDMLQRHAQLLSKINWW